jgi:hypothetical protein
MIRIGLVCIAKDEDYYLEEWLDYNYKLGFDKIIMYQNNWRTDIERPFLEKIEFDGNVKQLHAYNNSIQRYKNDYDYLAFIDCDEFIVLNKHNTIQDFVEEYKTPNAIALNWVLFGSQGKMERSGNSLLKQFTKCQSGVDRHIKIILNSQSNAVMTLPHNSNVPSMDTNRNETYGPFNPKGPIDVAYICHFNSKTYEDWKVRCKRGRADCELVSELNEWEKQKQNNCEVENLSALNFMYNK